MPEIVLDEPNLTFIGDDASLVFLDREIAEPDTPLVGQPWTIDTFLSDEGQYSMAFEGERPYIEFLDDGTFAFFTGCNNGGGEFVQGETTLALSNVGYEQAGCPEGFFRDPDSHIIEVLTGDPVTYDIEATRLTIRSGDLGFRATTMPTDNGEPAEL
jgi:heat shock protein HslJ